MTNLEHQKFWNRKYHDDDKLVRMSQHSIFVEQTMDYFPKGGRILELGTGTGADSLFLVSHGFKVVATDFSEAALSELQTRSANTPNLEIKQLDLSNPFPFNDQEFDVVYAHLSLHYFNSQTTKQIFDEIFRVLKPEGTIAVILNSVTDEEFGTGPVIEEDFFEIPGKGAKRFFRVETLKPFVEKFNETILDNKGSDMRRDQKEGLIRFIGKRP